MPILFVVWECRTMQMKQIVSSLNDVHVSARQDKCKDMSVASPCSCNCAAIKICNNSVGLHCIKWCPACSTLASADLAVDG
jgi:hypothetical protein